MYRLLLIAFLSISFNNTAEAFSAFTEGKIILKTGEELRGFVKFGGPQAIMASKIKFKKTNKGKEKKFKSNDVRYVIVTSTETPMVFEYSHYYKKLRKKKSKYKEWRRLVMSCDAVKVYVSNQFSFNKKGNMFFIYDKRISANKILFQRPGEEFPSVVGSTDENYSVGLLPGKRQTEAIAEYFSDDSSISSAVKKNKWNAMHFSEIGNAYCESAE